MNTLGEIIEFVMEGNEYGSICSENIIITKKDEIKLRDNRVKR